MNVSAMNTQSILAGLPRRALATSLLVAFLLIVHAALMTTEQHAAVMDLPYTNATMLVDALGPAHYADTDTGERHAPTTILGDCPAQRAILPLLLLIVLTLLTASLRRSARMRPQQPGRLVAPPLPLTLPRRLALLQTFLI